MDPLLLYVSSFPLPSVAHPTRLCPPPAAFPPLRRTSFLYLAAIIKGLGGSYAVMKTAELAFISENSPRTSRSFYLGLVMVTGMAGTGIAPLVSGLLVEQGKYTATFAMALAGRCLHLAYAIVALREPPHTRPETDAAGAPDPDRQTGASEEGVPAVSTSAAPKPPSSTLPTRTSPRSLLTRLRALPHLIINPLLLLARSPLLTVLGAITFLMSFSSSAFIVIIPWSDQRFGLDPEEAGVIAAMRSMARALSVLCMLPAAKVASRWLVEKRTGIRLPEGAEADRQPLIPSRPSFESDDADADADAPFYTETSLVKLETERETLRASAAQELWVCRFAFLWNMVGMLLVSVSRSPTQLAVGTLLPPWLSLVSSSFFLSVL